MMNKLKKKLRSICRLAELESRTIRPKYTIGLSRYNTEWTINCYPAMRRDSIVCVERKFTDARERKIVQH